MHTPATGPLFLVKIVRIIFKFLRYSFLFGFMRQIKLATRQLLGTH